MSYVFNEFQLKWLEALESGNYEQGRMYLKSTSNKYCCLGVGCELLNLKNSLCFANAAYVFYNDDETRHIVYAPVELQKQLKLKSRVGIITTIIPDSLVGMNDRGLNFKEIAKFCRENPDKVFTE